MTAQMNDKFIFSNVEYEISAIEYQDKYFDINSLGLKMVNWYFRKIFLKLQLYYVKKKI